MHKPVWQAPGVQIYGDVRFAGPGISLWPNAVIRAEVHHVKIGAYTNIQDLAMLHIGSTPTEIGEYCSITHHATIHGARIGDNCLIGIGATIMDEAEIGANSIVAGNCIVREGMQVPPNSIIAGVPGKVVAERNNYVANKLNAVSYYENGLAYASGDYRLWADPDYQARMEQLKEELLAEV